uniref:Uncharacterized protein n=1 Tax=Branchiostoma floridae TaxID=7739 RepID=C3YYR0_BRAFL|eukprot:XP_002598406.1 hypothetical protein BRAFLDRAFT_83181 [Branchiostoma floridae]
MARLASSCCKDGVLCVKKTEHRRCLRIDAVVMISVLSEPCLMMGDCLEQCRFLSLPGKMGNSNQVIGIVAFKCLRIDAVVMISVLSEPCLMMGDCLEQCRFLSLPGKMGNSNQVDRSSWNTDRCTGLLAGYVYLGLTFIGGTTKIPPHDGEWLIPPHHWVDP